MCPGLSVTNVRIDAVSGFAVCSFGRAVRALWRASASGDLDASSIDALYGLEPGYEPGKGSSGLLPEEFVAVQCPYVPIAANGWKLAPT